MNEIVGVRRSYSNRVVFVSCPDDVRPLHTSVAVTVEQDGERYPATVVIRSDQLVLAGNELSAVGVVVSAHGDLPLGVSNGSREDQAYRKRKAAFPLLGSRSETDGTSGTVVQIDLRTSSVSVRSDDGEVIAVQISA